jgi:hypothetical protein
LSPFYKAGGSPFVSCGCLDFKKTFRVFGPEIACQVAKPPNPFNQKEIGFAI